MNRTLLLISLVIFITSQQLVELKDDTFTQYTQIPLDFSKQFKLTHNWFIMFYAPWCHHCKQAIPEWVKLASSYKNNTRIGIVNCVANPDVC
jgi:thiol-disulfide isomerase/thioredoxin